MPGVSGVLPLAVVGAGGQMGSRALGVPVCVCGGGVLDLVCVCGLVGTGVSLQGWCSDFLGLTCAHRVLPNFLLSFFLLYHTLYSFMFLVTLQSCVIN